MTLIGDQLNPRLVPAAEWGFTRSRFDLAAAFHHRFPTNRSRRSTLKRTTATQSRRKSLQQAALLLRGAFVSVPVRRRGSINRAKTRLDQLSINLR
ncbi:MAG: hypothetical protein JNG88_00320 [Phycisphaerales bacterium]|nr:hypothetical protein [Phycisphaerales bacterium]